MKISNEWSKTSGLKRNMIMNMISSKIQWCVCVCVYKYG